MTMGPRAAIRLRVAAASDCHLFNDADFVSVLVKVFGNAVDPDAGNDEDADVTFFN